VLDEAALVVDGEQVALTPAHLLSGRRDPRELPFVGTGHRPHADHRVAVGGDLLDLEAGVGKGGPEALHHLALPLGPVRRAGDGVAVDELRGEGLVVDPGQVAVVEDLLDRTADPLHQYVLHGRRLTHQGSPVPLFHIGEQRNSGAAAR
jgi:hypothetical protein